MISNDLAPTAHPDVNYLLEHANGFHLREFTMSVHLRCRKMSLIRRDIDAVAE
jgi:hypothetical protein